MPKFRLRIRGRLYAGFMALVAVGLVMVVVAVWNLWAVQDQVARQSALSDSTARVLEISTHLQAAHRGDEVGQPLFFGDQGLLTERRQPVVRPSARIVVRSFSRGFGDQTAVEQLGQVPVERAGLQRHPAAGLLTDGLHDRVAVALVVSQREQDVKDGGLHRG